MKHGLVADSEPSFPKRAVCMFFHLFLRQEFFFQIVIKQITAFSVLLCLIHRRIALIEKHLQSCVGSRVPDNTDTHGNDGKKVHFLALLMHFR